MAVRTSKMSLSCCIDAVKPQCVWRCLPLSGWFPWWRWFPSPFCQTSFSSSLGFSNMSILYSEHLSPSLSHKPQPHMHFFTNLSWNVPLIRKTPLERSFCSKWLFFKPFPGKQCGFCKHHPRGGSAVSAGPAQRRGGHHPGPEKERWWGWYVSS